MDDALPYPVMGMEDSVRGEGLVVGGGETGRSLRKSLRRRTISQTVPSRSCGDPTEGTTLFSHHSGVGYRSSIRAPYDSFALARVYYSSHFAHASTRRAAQRSQRAQDCESLRLPPRHYIASIIAKLQEGILRAKKAPCLQLPLSRHP
jgi:hypothetical protein